MEPKGSRKNPYTMEEFNTLESSGSWNGGWVQNNDDLIYYSHEMSIYSGLGDKICPIPDAIFCEMQQNGLWVGGWVVTLQGVKYYYTAMGVQYESTLCNQSNPCPMSVYNEMVSNGIWIGGWVFDTNGNPHYVQNFQVSLDLGEGCGCGCGSGSFGGNYPDSGWGSGFGGSGNPDSYDYHPISSGSLKVGDFNIIFNSDVYSIGMFVHWTSGNTVGPTSGLSVVTISITLNSPLLAFQENNLYAIWRGAYQMAIRGSFTVRLGQDVRRYKIKDDVFVTIPAGYHH